MGHNRLHSVETTGPAIHRCRPHGGGEAHVPVHEQWHYGVGSASPGPTWTPGRELAVRTFSLIGTRVAGATALPGDSVCPPPGASTHSLALSPRRRPPWLDQGSGPMRPPIDVPRTGPQLAAQGPRYPTCDGRLQPRCHPLLAATAAPP